MIGVLNSTLIASLRKIKWAKLKREESKIAFLIAMSVTSWKKMDIWGITVRLEEYEACNEYEIITWCFQKSIRS